MSRGACVRGMVRDAETGLPTPCFNARFMDGAGRDVIGFFQSGRFQEGQYDMPLSRKASVALRLTIVAPGCERATSG